MMMKNVKFVWLILMSCIPLAGELGFAQDPPPSFVTPSGNIYCGLAGADLNLLRCEIRSRLNPLPPQPYTGYCEFDWGSGLLLSRSGKPEILCISDSIAGSDFTLGYGETWMLKGFKCVSEKTGLTCENTAKQGFHLSRKKWEVFRNSESDKRQ
jgi:hypothetical protein